MLPQKINSFKDLVDNTLKFESKIGSFKTTENRIERIAGDSVDLQNEIVLHAQGARIIVHLHVLSLIEDFLGLKRLHGSPIEKRLYSTMSNDEFIQRLFIKRPLVFYGPNDRTILRGEDKAKPLIKDWFAVGSSKEGSISLTDYLSYDEMQISALLGASTPTFFINDGNRNNLAQKGQPGTFQKFGIFLGLVGTRFKIPGKMEHQHMIIPKKIDKSGQRKEDVHKDKLQSENLLKIWAKFYGSGEGDNFHFPSFEEVNMLRGQEKHDYYFIENKQGFKSYFNIKVYKRRMNISIETILREANQRGIEYGKQSYVHVVGLGLGVWRVCDQQAKWMVDCFADLIKNASLPCIAIIDFSYFPPELKSCGDTKHGQFIEDKDGHSIKILFSKRNTSDLVDDHYLLVTSYAWDSNSFPGNEYWSGLLKSTSDSAAACCSTIPQLQNPYINPYHLNIKILDG